MEIHLQRSNGAGIILNHKVLNLAFSYTTLLPKTYITKIKDLDVGFSVHAPVFSDYFINLANNDFNTVLAGFQNTASVMQSLRSNIALFHGFL